MKTVYLVFNVTFNNISAILWLSVLLMQETGVPEKTTDLSQVTDKLCEYKVVLYLDTGRNQTRFKKTRFDCIVECTSNIYSILVYITIFWLILKCYWVQYFMNNRTYEMRIQDIPLLNLKHNTSIICIPLLNLKHNTSIIWM